MGVKLNFNNFNKGFIMFALNFPLLNALVVSCIKSSEAVQNGADEEKIYNRIMDKYETKVLYRDCAIIEHHLINTNPVILMRILDNWILEMVEYDVNNCSIMLSHPGKNETFVGLLSTVIYEEIKSITDNI